jgi:hypothetical protein
LGVNGPAKLLYEVTGQNRASSWSFSGKRRVISFTGSNALRCQSSLQPIRLAQRHSKGHNIGQQGRSPVIHAISLIVLETIEFGGTVGRPEFALAGAFDPAFVEHPAAKGRLVQRHAEDRFMTA